MDKIELQELKDEVTYLRRMHAHCDDTIQKLTAEVEVLRLQLSVFRANENLLQRMLTKEILKNAKATTKKDTL